MLDTAVNITFVLLLAGLALSCVRLGMGPTLPDRVVALDLITVLAMALCALYAIAAGHAAYVDVAIVLALVAFLATIAFARFVERRAKEDEDAASSDRASAQAGGEPPPQLKP